MLHKSLWHCYCVWAGVQHFLQDCMHAQRRLWSVQPRLLKQFHADSEDSSWKHAYIILTPLNPTFKTGLYRHLHYFSYFAKKNIDYGYSLERLAEAVLTSTHNLCFEQKYEYIVYQNFLSESFPFLVVEFSRYWNRRVFVMWSACADNMSLRRTQPYRKCCSSAHIRYTRTASTQASQFSALSN